MPTVAVAMEAVGGEMVLVAEEKVDRGDRSRRNLMQRCNMSTLHLVRRCTVVTCVGG